MGRALAKKPHETEATLLAKYRAMRDFDATSEPNGSARTKRAKDSNAKSSKKALRFVVQKHHASHLHYDFRLEASGVLMSWSVPKGPTLVPGERRLAMQTEDHPLDYYDFEGVIPAGNYGAGEVIVWDWGTWELVEGESPKAELHKGKIKFRLHGDKLSGGFTLVHMKGRGGKKDNAWLLLKEKDAAANAKFDVEKLSESVKTGRTLDDIANDPKSKRWISNRTAAKKDDSPAKSFKARVAAAARRARAQPHDKVPVVKHPMLATLVDAPFDGDEWLYEVKWDGIRALVTIDERGRVKAMSRNGKDLLPRFPSLASLGDAFTDRPIVVDGEIVALDASGKSSFQRLQRSGRSDVPITFVVFDALYAGGRDLRGEPLEARKETLEAIVRKDAAGLAYSRHVVADGKKLYALAHEQGLEGIIAKLRDSTYREKRTRDWLKIKVTLAQECVVGGFTDPRGSRTAFGALLIGVYDRGKLQYVGHVGTGFDRAGLTAVHRRLRALEIDASPFANKVPRTSAPVHWVKPELVAQVRFTEWTADGRMRHPTFLGLRDDKKPKECTREEAQHVKKPRKD